MGILFLFKILCFNLKEQLFVYKGGLV